MAIYGNYAVYDVYDENYEYFEYEDAQKMNRTVYMVLATVWMSRLLNSPFDLPNSARPV